MEYTLMRKDNEIALLDFSPDGEVLHASKEIKNSKLAPLAYSEEQDRFKLWWNERSVPVGRKDIAKMLKANGIHSAKQYLLNNLGLSLTDYYWVKPLGSGLKWKEVNLYENDFAENILYEYSASKIQKHSVSLSPNSSLKGDLEKSWVIQNGKRMLVKGNSDYSSEESINEVIASLLHKKQGWDNYTNYELIKIKDRKYRYGCICEAFTNQNVEFVSAWEIISSRKNAGAESYYKIFTQRCTELGMNKSNLIRDLDYQILSDYILSNRDRHMNNIGILRDAETLQPIRLAPIYDSGKCMWVGQNVPTFTDDIIDNETNSFCGTEKELLSLVNNRLLINTDRLPSASEISELYSADPKCSKTRIEEIIGAYKKKAEYFKNWQTGK